MKDPSHSYGLLAEQLGQHAQPDQRADPAKGLAAAAFADMIVDLDEYFKPRLSIIDGVVGMEGNGPTAGTPKKILVTPDGNITMGTPDPSSDLYGYVSHFATCPAAAAHRKKDKQ